jgi:hypothetical protein
MWWAVMAVPADGGPPPRNACRPKPDVKILVNRMVAVAVRGLLESQYLAKVSGVE